VVEHRLDVWRSNRHDMKYSASREDFKSVLEWLHGSDESQWQYQTTLLSDTIADLQRMAHPVRRPGKTGSRAPTIPPGADEINTAMPHLTNMLRVMQNRNRPAAIKSGAAGLALLPEGA
jgi:hypothetical protein